MQDLPGTGTSELWRKHVYLRKNIVIFLDVNFSSWCYHFLFLVWIKYTKLPISTGFLKVLMGKLEATKPPMDVAFLPSVYLLPLLLISSRDVLQTTRPCCAPQVHVFTFSLPDWEQKLLAHELSCAHLLLFSYFHRSTKEINNFNKDVRFTWPGKQHTTQHEQSQ